MNTQAKRNKFRGLQSFVAQHYDVLKHTPEEIHAALQGEEKWTGVGLDSVRTAVHSIRRENGAHSPVYRKKASGTPSLPNVLVTIPLPKKQSATMTVQEAFVVYKILGKLFGDK